MRFGGMRVLVTGAARGIGLAIVRAFLAEGAAVGLNDIDEAGLASAMESLRSESGSTRPAVAALPGDVTDPSAAGSIVERAVRELGGLEVLVSNAGVYPSRPFLEMPVEEYDRVMNVNARGTFLVCQAAARAMVASGTRGSIVTISSGSARFARAGAAHYSASKAAVVMLTRTMALELAPHGIRVNSVSPGPIHAEGGPTLAEEYVRAISTQIPMGRVGTPEDVAAVVLLAADPTAGYMTGQVLPVDGGLTAGRFGLPTSS